MAREEGWLAELLPSPGKLFINGDNDFAPLIAERAQATVGAVRVLESAIIGARKPAVDRKAFSFQVDGLMRGFRRRISHSSAWAASGAQRALRDRAWRGTRLEPEEIQRGPGRVQAGENADGILGIRMAFASWTTPITPMRIPCSRRCNALKELPCKGRRIAVLGDMAELGAHGYAAHEEVGRRAADSASASSLRLEPWPPHTAAARASRIESRDGICRCRNRGRRDQKFCQRKAICC